MSGEISPYLMRNQHGRGPGSKTCGECVFCVVDNPEADEGEQVCSHEKSPALLFIIRKRWKACGLFKSQWQHEREMLEAQGQLSLLSAIPRTVSCA